MNSLSLSRCALSVCVAGMLLAGCGGSQGLIGRSATGQPATAKQLGYKLTATDLSSSEVLTASHVRIETGCTVGGGIDTYYAHFRAQGNATGPFAGIFTAKGGWEYVASLGGSGYIFHESFTITSGSSQISGRIHSNKPFTVTCPPRTFGPSTMHYKTNNGHTGKVRVKIIKRNDFSETLYSL
jgi:hypothetical protein